jgi:uncharacterized protein (DUF433 family)
MESAKNGHRTVSGRRSTSKITAEHRNGRLDKTDPRSRAVNRSSRASRYASFAEEILRDLDPRGPLQRLAADHVVQSAWKLKANLEKQAARTRSEKAELDAEPTKGRIRPTELERASRSMRDALESLDYLRAHFPSKPEVSPQEPDFDAEIRPNEWPILPCDEVDDLPEVATCSDDEVPSWQDRLVFDFDVSDVSPVVKGTWITVGQVVSLIVDGWAWSDILRTHPELTEEDIRTCVAYAMAEENSAA